MYLFTILVDSENFEKTTRIISKYSDYIKWFDFSKNAFIGNEVVQIWIIKTTPDIFDKIVYETDGYKYFKEH